MINKYGDSTITIWELDDSGNKVSIPILNEKKQVIGNKIVLEGLPDEQYRVFIDDFVEIDIKDKITEKNQFKVDYRGNGIIFVHESLDGQWININQYASRGMYYIPASRIWTKVDEFGNIVETLEGTVEKIELVQDIVADLNQFIDTAIDLKNDLELTISTSKQLENTLDSTISVGETLKQELPSIIDNTNNSKIALENVISQSTSVKDELNNTIIDANGKKTELDNIISSANEIKSMLSNPTTGTIKQAMDTNNELKSTIQNSSTAKSDLENSIQNSISARNNLESSISEAINIKTGLDNSISEGNSLKGELEDIITGTDFEQVINDIADLKQDKHNHINKDVLDKLSDDNGALKFDGQDIGIGDMEKSIYDKNNNGVVDISEDSTKLGGYEPSYYAKQTELNNKVDKVEGKQLSTEDYTTEEKNKLKNIEENADKTTKSKVINALGYTPADDKRFYQWYKGDLNDLKTPGFYAGKNLTNAPLDGNCFIQVFQSGTTVGGDPLYIQKIYILRDNVVPPVMYTRIYNIVGNVLGWQKWYQDMNANGGDFIGSVDFNARVDFNSIVEFNWKKIYRPNIRTYVESKSEFDTSSGTTIASAGEPTSIKCLIFNLSRDLTVKFRNYTSNTEIDNDHVFSGTIVINQPSTVHSIKFESVTDTDLTSKVIWQNGEVPEMNKPNTSYVVTYMTYDKGQTYYLFYGGEFNVS